MPALAALVGGGDRGLAAELVAGAGLAFSDAFDLRRVESVQLVLVAGLLAQDPFGAFQRDLKRRFQGRFPGNLAADVADQP